MLNLFISPFGSVATPYDPKFGAGPGGMIIFFSNLIKMVIVIGGLLAFIQLILAGLQYIQSGGDSKQLEQAKDKIAWSVVGLMIMVAAFIIAEILSLLTGLNILNPIIYTPN